MKKIFGILLALAMTFSLAACGHSKNTEKVSEEKSENQDMKAASRQKSEDLQDAETDLADRTKDNGRLAETHDMMSGTRQEKMMGANTLVVYFSCTETTKTLAEYAADSLGADIYEIIAEQPYTDEDLAYYTNGRADQEQNDPSVRPAISGNVENMDIYETIILGYPIWHGQAPRIISTFLESYDFSGKTIFPFCTSHSSGIGSSDSNLHSLCSDSTIWVDGKRFGSETTKEEIENWLKESEYKWEN